MYNDTEEKGRTVRMKLDEGDHMRINKQVITNDGNQLLRIRVLMYINCMELS